MRFQRHVSIENRARAEMDYQIRNEYYFKWICGDHIVEQHVHNIDVMQLDEGGAPSSRAREGRAAGPRRQAARRHLRPPPVE